MIDTSSCNGIGAGSRHGLLGLYLDDVSEVVAQSVPDDEFAAIHKTAANAVGDIDIKAKVFCRAIAPHALRAVLRARELRIRAKAIATNAAACRRSRIVRRPASVRARRVRVAPAATRAPTGDPEGEPPSDSHDGPGGGEVRR